MPWNAEAAALNFDHIMGSSTKERAGFHDWYGLPAALASWEAVGEYEFKLTFSSYYEPALRELSFIRPFRFISPAGLPDMSDNKLSCNEWKPWANAVRTWGPYQCVGIKQPLGTGPYKIMAKRLETASGSTRLLHADEFSAACSNGGGTTLRYLNCQYNAGEYLTELIFDKFEDYTPTPTIPAPTYDKVIMKAYESQAAVREALLDGSLDMAYGLNALSASGFMSLAARDDSTLKAHIADHDLNTRFIGLHSGGRLNTTSLRKMVMCKLDRTLLFNGELAEEDALETLFDPNLPYVKDATSSLSNIGTLCGTSTSMPTDLTQPLRFLYPTGSAHVEGIVYYMIGKLSAAGIIVTPMPKTKDDYNSELGKWAGADGEAYTADDWPNYPSGTPITTPTWDMAYSETWGPMYDASTSLTDIAYTWPAEVWSEATNYLETIEKGTLNNNIRAIAAITNDNERQTSFNTLIQTLHEEAIFLPLTAKRNTAVTNKGVSGFQFSPTEYGSASVIASLYPTPTTNSLSGNAIAGITIGVIIGVALLSFIALLISREKQGTPLFTSLDSGVPDKAAV